MSKTNDLTNKQFGLLTALECVGKDSSGHKVWKCQCKCGNIINVRSSRLTSLEKTDCGCIKKHGFVDETGKRYGRLTVLEPAPKGNYLDRSIRWICQCDCGNITIVNGGDLRQGKTRSCGCLMNESRGKTLVTNEIGNRYGKLTVVDRIIKDNKTYWECLCDCGNMTTAYGPSLREGRKKSCGCVSSLGEQQIIDFLLIHNITYKSEYTFSDLKTENNGFPRFDFAIFKDGKLNCLIEFQGIQHYIDKGNFGKYQREVTDKLKQDYCFTNKIPLFYIKYNDNIEDKLNSILL